MEAEAFKQWRERTGYSQSAAAMRFLQVTRTTVQNWEAGATQIPPSVEAACKAWDRRLRQEDPVIGPVILFFSNGPMFRDFGDGPLGSAVVNQERLASNNQALVRVRRAWGDYDFQDPFIIDRGGDMLWTSEELAEVMDGNDFVGRFASVIQVLADDTAKPSSVSAPNRPASFNGPEADDRARQIKEIAADLSDCAKRCDISNYGEIYRYVESRVSDLRRLKRPNDTLVSDLAKLFVIQNSIGAARSGVTHNRYSR